MNDYKTITIYGTGRYMYVSSPDTQFDKNGIYHTTLEVPQDKAQEAIKEIDGVIGKEIAAAHKAKPNEKTVKRASTPYTNEGAIVTFKVKSKFKLIRPKTLGQALRIDGITPAAVYILLSYVKKYKSKIKIA